MVEYFLKVYQDRLHTSSAQLTAPAINALLNYAWPGNIRELENTIHRALLVSSGGIIHPKYLHLPYLPIKSESDRLTEHRITGEKTTNELGSQRIESVLTNLFEQGTPDLYEFINALTVRKAYDYCNNNQVHTAKLLGISRNILRARLKELNLIA